jgi:hypothetical protein
MPWTTSRAAMNTPAIATTDSRMSRIRVRAAFVLEALSAFAESFRICWFTAARLLVYVSNEALYDVRPDVMASGLAPARSEIAFDEPMKLSACATTASMFAKPPNCWSCWSDCRIEADSFLIVCLAACRSSGVAARIAA